MALTFVEQGDAVGPNSTFSSPAAGDIALVFAYRDGSNTAPSLPAGWTNIAFSGANSNSARVGYRVLLASDAGTGTWTNATEVSFLLLRGQHASPLGGVAAGGANSNQISYTGFTLVNSGTPQGASWVVGFAGHRTATDVYLKDVSGMTTRSGDSAPSTLGTHTDESVSGSFATVNYSSTVDASSGWRSYAIEIRAAATEVSTGTARLSLAAANVPATRTNHLLAVRARVTTATDQVLRAQLYDGATNITDTAPGYLQSSVLTTSFANYTLAIADADAAAISSYGDLEVRLWGVSPGGSASVFEVANVSMGLPFGTLGAQSGAVQTGLTFTAATQGTVTGAGTKQTGQARISLAGGYTPLTRTSHVVNIRARRTALQGVLRAQLYEGLTPRSAVLETGELTTSLALYSLAVSDADAATIGSYSDLELRVWGYSSTGAATVFEVAEASLELPGPALGLVEGSLVIGAVTAVNVDTTGLTVYPGTNVFPHGLIVVSSVSDMQVTATQIKLGSAVLPLQLNIITSADVPATNRTGAVLVTSVSALTPTGAYVRKGALDISAASSVFVTTSGQTSAAQVAISAASTVSFSGVVPAAALPPDYIDIGFPDLPDLLIAAAFDSEPLHPLQVYTGLTPFVRGINAKRGRQFELDRVEAGTSSFLLDNLDGRFSPENTGGPYYPNLIPNKRVRWKAFWSGTEYFLYSGFMEGYPQEFPHVGFDSVVRQSAVDAFMPLAHAKFLPGSTVLTSALVQTPAEGTPAQEVIEVGGTALPMPQAVPFTVTIGDEELTVTEIVSNTQYRVARIAGAPAHTPGASVLTTAISFGEAYTGTRVTQVLASIGITDADIEAGQALLAPSEDLAGQTPLEHLLSVAEWEQGRFFAAADGTLTFHSRHRVFLNELTSRQTFGDNAGEFNYSDIKVTHEDEKIYNIVRITPASGNVQEVRDEGSIDDHFERVLEKTWPLANDNEALAAARYLIYRYSRMQVRIPELLLEPRSNTAMYPTVLGMELGQRYRVIRRPDSDAVIDKQLIVEGVSHELGLSNMQTRVQLSLHDTRHYWLLNTAGYGELGQTTTVGY